MDLLSSFAVLSLFFHLPIFSSSSTSDIFDTWCTQHRKTYSSDQEKQYRLRVFEDNYAFVSRHNSMPNSSYSLSLNSFADLTHHEFRASRLGLAVKDLTRLNFRPSEEPSSVLDVPSSADWRKSGAVTSVKDQGSCGIWTIVEFDESSGPSIRVGLSRVREFVLSRQAPFLVDLAASLPSLVIVVAAAALIRQRRGWCRRRTARGFAAIPLSALSLSLRRGHPTSIACAVCDHRIQCPPPSSPLALPPSSPWHKP
ncbi:cathepsin L [Sarracenia purpurea var. burkii]